MAAGLAAALVHLALTARARVAWHTGAGEAGDAIHAAAMVAWVRGAVVHVALAQGALEALRAATLVAIRLVHALSTVPAGRAGAFIHIELTSGPTEAGGAGTAEAINSVLTDAAIDTWATLTLVDVHFAISPCEACHTDTGELANAVQASGLVAARPRKTLVNIGLTARSSVAATALAQERPLCIHATTQVFTRVGANGALVHILVTRPASEAGWTGADGPAVHRVCVADSILVTRVADTGIIQVAQKSSLAHGAGAVEGGHTVMAGGTMEAHSRGTVIDILTTALSSPAVDTHTAVATQSVEAGAPIVAGIGLQLTLVHILRAELACPLGRTLAVVSVDTIHAGPPVETPVSWAVIHIHFAVLTLKPGQAGTVIGEIATLPTRAPVAAR